jgi:Mlc titration factor MtfA (ptsG expression regulator)
MSFSRWFGGFFSARPEITDSAWNDALGSRLYARLGEDERVRLRELAARFLVRKSFTAAAGHELTESQRIRIAALACLPVLHLGFDWLAGWREVIVYPGEFRVKREHHDEHTGVVTEGEDELIGEAWERGPVILSWADIATDLERPFDGFNVVAHEIAHKLDMLDGAMNGVPRLPPGIARREWIEALQAAYDALVRAVERGRDTFIDPYAAESPDEFFAVTSELHFSDPAGLARAAPEVAAMLARFYGPRGSPPARAAKAR